MTADRAKLILAVPSKGRLQEKTIDFFTRAGLILSENRHERQYIGNIVELDDVEVRYVSASEIASQLGSGNVHLGVTGRDLIEELEDHPARTVELIAPLDFGRATVVVAVPKAWIDVHTMADLDEVAGRMRVERKRTLRVATKYVNLTRRFFAEKGLVDYRIVESLGATEGAPASKSAEIIVDITTTGTTLAANNLKVLEDGIVLDSQAHLVGSLGAYWGRVQREAVRVVLDRIVAEERARLSREIRFWYPASENTPLAQIAEQYGCEWCSERGQTRNDEVVWRCRSGAVFPLANTLMKSGAEKVTVRTVDYVFAAENPMVDRLLAKVQESADD